MRVLAITAHPDDMEFMCAGTLLKCKARGDEVFVCTINNGNMGHLEIMPDELAEIRKAFEESGVAIEAMDGSHQANNTTDMVASFLAHAEIQEDDGQETPVMKMT